MTSAKSCRVGLIGGGPTILDHAKAFSAIPGVELVGICNRTRSKAEGIAAELSIPHVDDNIDNMIGQTRPDLLCMAVYEPAIFEVACRALAHPVALFMEKPIGLDLLEARKVHEAAKKFARRVWVGLNRRTIGSTQAALTDLTANPGPRFIHIQDQQSLATAQALGHAPEVVRNWMYANSIHLVDYLLAFGRGTIEEVIVLQPWDEHAPGVVVAHVAFSSGDKAIYQAVWNGPGRWACTVSAPHRRWELLPLEKASYQNLGERTFNEVAVPPDDVKFKPGFYLQGAKVIGAWRGEETGAVTIDDAMATTKLVARIYGLERAA